MRSRLCNKCQQFSPVREWEWGCPHCGWSNAFADYVRVSEYPGALVMPDIKPFVSPLSGKVLSSRKHVQHEERGYGVRQAGELRKPEDFKSHKPVEINDRRLERAFQIGLEKTGLA